MKPQSETGSKTAESFLFKSCVTLTLSLVSLLQATQAFAQPRPGGMGRPPFGPRPGAGGGTVVVGPTQPGGVIVGPGGTRPELCNNGLDDNGNGYVDEGPCIVGGGGGPVVITPVVETRETSPNAWFYHDGPAINLRNIPELGLGPDGAGLQLQSIQLEGWSGDGTSNAYIMINGQHAGTIILAGGNQLHPAWQNQTAFRTFSQLSVPGGGVIVTQPEIGGRPQWGGGGASGYPNINSGAQIQTLELRFDARAGTHINRIILTVNRTQQGGGGNPGGGGGGGQFGTYSRTLPLNTFLMNRQRLDLLQGVATPLVTLADRGRTLEYVDVYAQIQNPAQLLTLEINGQYYNVPVIADGTAQARRVILRLPLQQQGFGGALPLQSAGLIAGGARGMRVAVQQVVAVFR